jgi:outer membrane lipoprotein-sorting protein
MKKLQIATPIALAVVLGSVISGCTAGQPQLTASDIIQKMRDTAQTTTSVQSTFDLNLTINKEGLKTLAQGLMGSMGSMGNMGGMMGKSAPAGGTKGMAGIDFSQLPDSASATINFWRQSPDKMRADIVTASYPEIKGSSLIYDGQKAYALDAANKTLYTVTPSKVADKIPAQMKAMMASIDVEQMADKVMSATNVSLVGTEKVAGNDAYKLDITVKPDAATLLGLPQAYAMPVGVLIKDLHATLYVDASRFIPLKFTLEHPQMGSFTYTATSLDVNKPIDASTFVMQVPAGYTTVDLDQKVDSMHAPDAQHITLPDAKAAAQKEGWTLLEPSYVPSGATLVDVTQMQAGMPMGGAYMLSYSAPSSDFSIMQAKTEMPGKLGDSFSGVNGKGSDAMKTVPLRGVEAKVFSPGGSGWTSLIWQEKDSHIWVALSGKLTTDEAVKIAESLK